jgi:23S rRNA (cytosine1962-C5)-methyltransferase
MFSPDQYQLLDFGDGRRLERFGPFILDRPCPAAERTPRADPAAWQQADARFDRSGDEQGTWTCRRELPERWTIACGRLVLELKPTDFGHLGVFPEQSENWEWITEQCLTLPRRASEGDAGELLYSRPGSLPASHGASPAPRVGVLNLFAYTGGSTLAAAAAGAEVVHVDAAENIVAWARRNAEHAGLAEARIRWIAEDAMKFVQRELRRGNRYNAVILDPPSYGHGPRGEVWRLSTHLPQLLRLCAELTAGRRQFVVLTCHTPGFSPARLRDMLGEALAVAAPPPGRAAGPGTVTARQLTLRAASGRELPGGVVVRWSVERSLRQ